MTEERTTEKWKCHFFTTDTGIPRPGDLVFHYCTFFLAKYEDSTEWIGECESSIITPPDLRFYTRLVCRAI